MFPEGRAAVGKQTGRAALLDSANFGLRSYPIFGFGAQQAAHEQAASVWVTAEQLLGVTNLQINPPNLEDPEDPERNVELIPMNVLKGPAAAKCTLTNC